VACVYYPWCQLWSYRDLREFGEAIMIMGLVSNTQVSIIRCHQIDAGSIRSTSVKTFQLELHVLHWGLGHVHLLLSGGVVSGCVFDSRQ
jgi:hypothetical protein